MRWWSLSLTVGLAACGGGGSDAKSPPPSAAGSGGQLGSGGNNNVSGSGSGAGGQQVATGGGPAAPAPTALSIDPPAFTLLVGKPLQLRAKIKAEATAVKWTLVEPAGCGAIDDAGVYTAPAAVPNPAVCHVRATGTADTSLVAQARLLIVDKPSGGTAGKWVNLPISISSYVSDAGGAQTVVVDPVRPSDVYAFVSSSDSAKTSVLKSTDFGLNWQDVNKTEALKGTPWGAAIDPNPQRDPESKPTLYCPAGFGALGMWKSTDGGVTWKQLFGDKTPFDDYNPYGVVDAYGATILPDDPPNHILVGYHYGFKQGGEAPQTNDGGIGESTDGGKSWTVHPPAAGFGNSHYIIPVDAMTWLIIAQENGGKNGIWKTSTAGRVAGKVDPSAWKKVDNHEHVHGSFQHYVDPVSGAIYLPGVKGIKRSLNKGDTWEWAYQNNGYVSSVLATESFLYSNYRDGPELRRASRRDGTGWAEYTEAPGGMRGAPPYGNASTFDGVHWILIEGGHQSGLWRYVEP